MLPNKKCGNCKYLGVQKKNEADYPCCRRYAPKLSHNPYYAPDSSVWPGVSLSDWCGEWKQGRETYEEPKTI